MNHLSLPASVSSFVKWVELCLMHVAVVRIRWGSGYTGCGPRHAGDGRGGMGAFCSVCSGTSCASCLLPPFRCHHLKGLRGCLLNHQNVMSTVRKLGPIGRPTEQSGEQAEAYFQLPGHLGQIKHIPPALLNCLIEKYRKHLVN